MDYNELEPKIVFQYFKEISNIPAWILEIQKKYQNI